MAFIVNYNSTLHDLYVFSGSPTIDPTDYTNNAQVSATSYNSSLYIKDVAYGLPSIDFSGIDARTRGAPAYGFDQFDGQPGFQPSGVKIDPGTGNISYPDILSQFILYDVSSASADCYYPGCPPANYTYASNFNFWNNGQYSKILISPKHFIATSHYVGTATAVTANFLGKNNQVYTKTATKVLDYRNNPIFPPGYDWGSVSDSDICLFELDVALSLAEQSQLKIYKFLNNYGIPSNTPAFHVIPQGMVVVKDANDGNTHYFSQSVYPNAAYQGVIDDLGNTIINAAERWSGDSGTPVLSYVPRLDETCFLELQSGGGGIYDNLLTPPTQSKQFFDLIKQYIYDQIGYEIELVNYTANPSPPVPGPSAPYPPVLNINGNTFSLEILIEPSPGRGSTMNFAWNAAPGYTYAIALVAYNKNGISSPRIVSNIYLPPQ